MYKILTRYVTPFLIILAWFYWTSPWYPASRLVITGNAGDVDSGRIDVRWDSGNDLNGYEMRRFPLRPSPIQDSEVCEILVTKTGRGPNGSSQSQVILQGVEADNVQIAPVRMAGGAVEATDDGRISLRADGSAVSFIAAPKHHLRFDFFTYNFAGDATIDICGDVADVYLYTSNEINQWSRENSKRIDRWYIAPDGSYSIQLDLPRYPIRNILVQLPEEFTLESSKIIDDQGHATILDGAIDSPLGTVYELRDRDKLRQQLFHKHRLIWQVLFAIVTVAILRYCFSCLQRFGSIKATINDEKRYLFWLFFAGALVLFSFWLIAFWPGIASTDSLKIWRAAQIPGMYLGDHPPLNVVFYMYLSMIWNNMAVVPLFHVMCSSLFIAYFYYNCYRWGVSLVVVILFYLLTVLSVPIGLYNVVLWKDVPFAYLVVLLALKTAKLYYSNRFEKKSLTKNDCLQILILLLLLAGTRYNGLVFVIVIPVLLIGLRVYQVQWKYLATLIMMLTVLSGVAFTLQKGSSAGSFVTMQVSKYFADAVDDISFETAIEKWEKYGGIFDVNQKFMEWDHLHNCFWWRFNNDFLIRVQWFDVYPYLSLSKNAVHKKIADYAVDIYELSYNTPFVYFSWNPRHLLYLLLLIPFLIRWFPMSAVFSCVLLSQIAALVFLDIMNWRYYYFAFLGITFLLPLVFADRARMRTAPH